MTTRLVGCNRILILIAACSLNESASCILRLAFTLCALSILTTSTHILNRSRIRCATTRPPIASIKQIHTPDDMSQEAAKQSTSSDLFPPHICVMTWKQPFYTRWTTSNSTGLKHPETQPTALIWQSVTEVTCQLFMSYLTS
jgi:hypothetical protein